MSHPKTNLKRPLPPLGNPFDTEKIITCPVCGEQTNLTPPELTADPGAGWQCRECEEVFIPHPGQTYLGL